MRAPPDGRSPAAGRRYRASIILTGKINNSSKFQIKPTGQVNQAHWQRLSQLTARIVERLRRLDPDIVDALHGKHSPPPIHEVSS